MNVNTLKSFLLLACMVCTTAAIAADNASDEETTSKYTKVTVPTLSDALFKIGVLRPTDPAAVDEYIRIHHCGIYEQYGSDDLSWTRIREAQARELTFETIKMNEFVEAEGAVTLDRYDVSQNAFTIMPAEKMTNLGLIKLAEFRSGSFDPCEGEEYKSFVPRVHPIRLTARLSNPLTLGAIPMSQTAADKLIKDMNSRSVRSEKQRRVVTFVIRMRLTGADPLAGSSDNSTMTVTADMDEILAYDGPDRKNLLFKQVFENPADKKKKKR